MGNGLKINVKNCAVALTECDITKFNQYLILLNHPSIPVSQKKEAALFVKGMNEALKDLQKRVDEKAFNIFYNYYFQGQSVYYLAHKINLDASTITRKKNKVLNELSVDLYPDLHMISII